MYMSQNDIPLYLVQLHPFGTPLYFVFVYIHVFVYVHQTTQPGVLILTMYLYIPHATSTVPSVLIILLNY